MQLGVFVFRGWCKKQAVGHYPPVPNISFPQVVYQNVANVEGYLTISLLQSYCWATVKEFWKSVSIWRSYSQQYNGPFLAHSGQWPGFFLVTLCTHAIWQCAPYWIYTVGGWMTDSMFVCNVSCTAEPWLTVASCKMATHKTPCYILLLFYGHNTRQPALAYKPVKNWRILFQENLTACMPLMIANSSLRLRPRCQSLQWCYLHRLWTISMLQKAAKNVWFNNIVIININTGIIFTSSWLITHIYTAGVSSHIYALFWHISQLVW